MEIGRNEVCPCGSGKKYKKCCLLKKEGSFEESGLLLEAENRMNNKIFAYYSTQADNALTARAGKLLFGDDFNLSALCENQAQEVMLNQFAIFDYKHSDGLTLFEKFRAERYQALDEDEKRVTNQWSESCWGMFEIQEVYPGQGSFIKDVFTNKEYNLQDIASSSILKRWDIVFAKIYPLGNVWRFGCIGFLSGQMHKIRVTTFIQETYDEYRKRKIVASLEEFIRLYPNIIIKSEFSYKPPYPKMISAEGDEMEICEAVYRLNNPDEVVKILEKQSDFSQADIKMDAAGNPVKYIISWLNAGDSAGVVGITPGRRPPNLVDFSHDLDSQDAARILGNVIINVSQLSIETTTKKRMTAGKKRIEALLGNQARHIHDRVTSLEQYLREHKEISQRQPEEDIPKEIKDEFVAKQLEIYASKWADLSIPMLEGLSPREASMTQSGEKLLAELFKYMENMEMRAERFGSGHTVPVSVLRGNLVRAKEELEQLITGETLEYGQALLEKNALDLLADLNSFIDFVKENKVRLTAKQQFIPDVQVRKLNEKFRVKEQFEYTIHGKTIENQKQEMFRQRLYLIDMLARESGIALISSRGLLEIATEKEQPFSATADQLKLWRLFASWWYKLYWNQSLPRDIGLPETVLFDSLLKKTLIEALVKKGGGHYPWKELAADVFEQLGREPDSIIYFGPLLEQCVIKPLEWFGLIETRKEVQDYQELNIKIDEEYFKRVETLKLTPLGKTFLSRLIVCVD